MRPLKLRAVVETQTSPSASSPAPSPAQAPQPEARRMAPASVSAASVPSAMACSVVRVEAGATSRRVPRATRRPRSTSAAMRRSASLAPVQAPM